MNYNPKLSSKTIEALKVALPDLMQQAQAMADKTKITSHRERVLASKRGFEVVLKKIENNLAWADDDYWYAHNALYLACEYVQSDADFGAAWDEIYAEMQSVGVAPQK